MPRVHRNSVENNSGKPGWMNQYSAWYTLNILDYMPNMVILCCPATFMPATSIVWRCWGTDDDSSAVHCNLATNSRELHSQYILVHWALWNALYQINKLPSVCSPKAQGGWNAEARCYHFKQTDIDSDKPLKQWQLNWTQLSVQTVWNWNTWNTSPCKLSAKTVHL